MRIIPVFFLIAAAPLFGSHRLPIMQGKPPPSAQTSGFDISAYYANDLVGNPIGGAHQGFANAGAFGVNWSLDFEKIANWNGFSFFNSLIYSSGRDLSARSIHNEFPVQQLYTSETYRLVELYLQESLYNQRLLIKMGRLCGGNDFLTSPLYLRYVTDAICSNPIAIFFNTPFQAYPFTEWGAYLGFKPAPCFLMKWAVYNTNQQIQKNKYHGANFTFHSPQGVFLITEWHYLLNQEAGDSGLSGNYKIGGYYITGKTAKFEDGDASCNAGYYFLFDQMFYRQGLTAWGAFLFAPKSKNEFPFFMAAGLIDKGIVASRPDDALCFGIAYGHYSPDLRHIELAAKRSGLVGPWGRRPQTAETDLELNYWIHVNRWIDLTPVAQFIINPKGYGTIQNALTLGMQVLITLQ
jgi:porin